MTGIKGLLFFCIHQTMERLLIQPSYSIEDIYLALSIRIKITLLLSGDDWDPTIPDQDASAGNLLHVYGIGLPKQIRLEEYSCYSFRCGKICTALQDREGRCSDIG
jgi:hypothetical protein